MTVQVKAKFGGCRVLFIVSLLVMLLSSLFVCMLTAGASLDGAVHVGNESELKNAISNAESGVPMIIALDRDITLTKELVISANQGITLTSSSGTNFFKLIGADGESTITVMPGGLLNLDGIIVTHATDATGCGVTVNSGGALFLYGGEISNNKIYDGGGVKNSGRFSMSGGKISNNIAPLFNYSGGYFHPGSGGSGGGVYNTGSFSLSGGVISNNIADLDGDGGGVYNSGIFEMSGGVISNNMAAIGRGVSNVGTFSLSSGTISKNTGGFGGSERNAAAVLTSGTFSMSGGVISDGGVYNLGSFSMSSGTISNSQAYGVYNSAGCTFSLSGGEISNNAGFGVHNLGMDNWYAGWTYGLFSMSGGVIRNNACGVQNGGNFSLSGGEISNNAGENGGGVQNSNLFSMFGGEISNNQATKGGGVYNYPAGDFSLSKNGVISNNTAEIGGGVCIDGDFSMFGGEISGNTARNQGGGVYVGNGIFRLSGGRILSNTANSGGGIWVSVEKLDKLFITDSVMFSNNRASAAYNRDPAHDGLYNSHIGSKVTWSDPFTQGYNNYDISYTSDSPVTGMDDGSSGSYNGPFGMDGYLSLAIVILAIVVGVTAVLFYFKNRLKR
ncbi:MAG: hypothetical protein LBI79_02490 [Nitrososphaerota archaeon]|nr:hypothetical protein [Nitrososphaerota archaeon]